MAGAGFTQAQVTRACKGAKAAGVEIDRVEVNAGSSQVVIHVRGKVRDDADDALEKWRWKK